MAGMGGWFRWPLKGSGKPEPAAPPPERERWDVFEIDTSCMGVTHPVTFGVLDGVVKSIKTPCGYAAARAMDALSSDDKVRSCWQLVELVVHALTDDEVWRHFADGNGAQQIEALGGRPGAEKRAGLRAQRRAYANMSTWNRRELTTAALLRLVQKKAGPGTTVTLDNKTGTNCITIKHDDGATESSTYHFIAGSWGAGSGPQGPDEVYRALQQWGRVLAGAELRLPRARR
jgi:hypothetical protein